MYKDVAKRILASILIITMIGSTPDWTLLAGVGVDAGTVMSPAVAGISINDGDDSCNVQMNGTLQLTAKTEDVSGNAESITEGITWASDDNSIVEVSTGGQLTGKAAGETSVSVTVDGTAITDTITVKVYDVAAIAINEGTSCSIEKGSTKQLNLAYTHVNGGSAVTSTDVVWNSGDSNVVTVSDTGLLTAQDTGNTSVTVTSAFDAAIQASIDVTVTEASVAITAITINEGDQNIKKDDSVNLSVTLEPEGASVSDVEWAVSPAGYVSVDANGKITGLAAGTATVTAAYKANGTISASITVSVYEDSDKMEVVLSDSTYTFLNKPIQPGVTVTDTTTSTVLAEGTDYTVSFSNNLHAGTATVKVMGKAGTAYAGTGVEKTFTIEPADFETLSAQFAAECTGTYIFDENTASTGMRVEASELVVKYTVGSDEYTLDSTKDFTIAGYRDNKKAGKDACVILQGAGDYTGQLECSFTIHKPINHADIKAKVVNSEGKWPSYDGTAHELVLTLTDNSTKLTENTDYEITGYLYSSADGSVTDQPVDTADIKNAGTYKIQISGKDVYTGSTTASYDIEPKVIEDSMVTLPDQVSPVTAESIQGLEIALENGTKLTAADYTITVGSVKDITETNGKISKKVDITIQGKGNYGGSVTKTVNVVTQVVASEIEVTLLEDEVVYTGLEAKPGVKVLYDGETLTEGVDYTVKTDQTDVKENVPVTIVFKGKYTGEYTPADKTFSIKQKQINDADVIVEKIPNQAYNGSPIEPEVTITYNGLTVASDEYNVSYSNNVDEGSTATVLITAADKNFCGSKETTFKIGTSIAAAVVTGVNDSYVFTSEEITPEPVVTLDDTKLTEGTDYEVVYENNVNAYFNPEGGLGYDFNRKDAKIHIIGINEYGGEVIKEFRIEQKDIKTSGMSIDVSDVEFTGGAMYPEVTIKFTNANGKVYELKDQFEAEALGDAYNRDLTIMPATDKGGGKYTVRIDGFRNFKGYVEAEVALVAKSIATTDKSTLINGIKLTGVVDMEYDPDKAEQKYELVMLRVWDTKRDMLGDPAEAEVPDCYELVKGSDYKVTYLRNTTPGQALFLIEGIGNYQGTYQGTFNISADIGDADINFYETDWTYTGKEIKPNFDVFLQGTKLNKGTDYTYSFSNNINAGTATLTIKGAGGYIGRTITDTFTIKPADIASTTMSHMYDSYSFIGENINVYPEPYLTYGGKRLVKGTDYDITFEEVCWNSGEHNFTIYALEGNYYGSWVVTYFVGDSYTSKNIEITLIDGNTYTYTGDAIEPAFTVYDSKESRTLRPGVDFAYEYENNFDAGTATLHTWGIHDSEYMYAGNVSITFAIEPKSLLDDTQITVESVSDEDFCREEIKPEPAVFWTKSGGTPVELRVDEDFIYVYENNLNAGTAKVIVRGINNFSGDVEREFEIRLKDISEPSAVSGVTVDEIPNQPYTGAEIKPQPKVVWDGVALTADKDYSIAYTDNIELGVATMTVTGIGNYTGEIVKTFRIVEVPVKDLIVEYGKDWTYTGKSIEPEVKIYQKIGSAKVQLDNKNFTIDYKNTIDAGKETGKIIISALDTHYTGTEIFYYTIKQRNLSDATITIDRIPNQILGTNGAAEPLPVLTFRPDATTTYTLILGADYEISYTGNTKVGQNGTVKITGRSNFTGTVSQTFYIGEDIKNYITSIEFAEHPIYTYNGTAQTPKIKVNMVPSAAVSMVEGKDYEILYDGAKIDEIVDDSRATKAGTHKVAVSGLSPYGGSLELTYEIGKRDISLVDFTIAEQPYTGSPVYPLIAGHDEKAKTRLGEDESTAETIGDISMEGMWTNLNAFTTKYQGNHTDIGIVTVDITATEASNYKGSTTAQFKISPKDLQSTDIVSSIVENQEYTGDPIRPGVTIEDQARNSVGTAFVPGVNTEYYKLIEGTDYDVTYTDNIYPGTVTMTITGKNHYTGTLTKQFDIGADLSKAEIAPIPAQAYTGLPVTPKITVTMGELTLKENFDYTVSYADNVERGTATVTISPVAGSMFTGSKTATFEISRELNAKTTEVRLIADNFVFTGDAITPKPVVIFAGSTLVEGVDYTVSYSNNINVGTATVTVTGLGIFEGAVNKNFTIVRRSIIRCSFENVVNQLYSGGVTTQNVLVRDGNRTLVENRDYTVTYANNINPGAASVILTGTGNYAGIKTVHYMINVRDIGRITGKATSASVIQLSWEPVLGAHGYAIYNEKNDLIGRTTKTSFKHKKLKTLKNYKYKVRAYTVSDGTTYYGGFSNLLTVRTLTKVPAKLKVTAGDDQLSISWKKVKGVSGYVIYRSTKKNGKYKKVKTLKKASSTSWTNVNLPGGKRYYYKVKAYKTINGKKIYSKYTSPKSAKTY